MNFKGEFLMENVFDVLKERGFVKQTTHEEEIRDLLGKNRVTFYTGFDPTGDSLHIGHFIPLMAMAHMQRAGHRPIALVGGATALIGDPTGKTDMRKMLTQEQIQHNSDCFKKQISKFIDFENEKAVMVNNADWLMNLNYVDFLRNIGVHFSVNRMIAAECFKSRLEGKGLTFIEFNYMLMQGYDFLELRKKFDCILQLGGDDQWANILGGIELVRKVEGREAFGMTFSLLETSEGKKMGKTESGALWLDADKTTPYEFYQYWRNVQDGDVLKCLSLLTFIPMDEVKRLSSLKDKEINKAKKVLAYEVTKLVHGETEAENAKRAAESLFSGDGNSETVPHIDIEFPELSDGIKLIDLIARSNLTSSKSEARRAIEQGGISVNEEKITNIDRIIVESDIKNNGIMLQKGKKSFCKINIL
jgi:tyrosyl-tRNA synthetase